MKMSREKYEILEALLFFGEAVRPIHVAQEIEKKFPSTMMHIIGLSRMGYAYSPEKGEYIISEKGKTALGLPEVNQEKAKEILRHLPDEKSFRFYASIGKPLNVYMNSLQDFGEKIMSISPDFIEFHMSRGDFEAWLAGIGDLELAKIIGVLRKRKIAGKALQKKLHEIIERRFATLVKIAD